VIYTFYIIKSYEISVKQFKPILPVITKVFLGIQGNEIYKVSMGEKLILAKLNI
jgi:hypothetical protein